MSTSLNPYKALIKEGKLDEAIKGLSDFIENSKEKCTDEAFYLLGNAYRKQGNWQKALNNYLEAIERNPNSPAVQAHQMTMDILNFYNKDMYNQ
ncbi:MAG: tetratricopeptide repeat protein [Bacteroides sp.]|nr:tetratricopeptide repeat protein [Bacteroides sp.]